MKNTFIYINILLLGFFGISSCQQDDVNLPESSARDLQTQANLDDQKIRALLTNYTFNDKDFEIINGVDKVKDSGYTHENIKFIRIKDNNGTTISLTEDQKAVSTGTSLIDSDFLDSIPGIQSGNVNYTAYFLKLREGKGKPVTIDDPVLTTYKGELLGDTAESFVTNQITIGDFFDKQTIPVWSSIINGNLGFTEIVSKFKTAIPIPNDEFDKISDPNQLLLKQCQVFVNTDTGEIGDTIENSYGIAVAFIPSGIGFGPGSVTNTNGSDISPYQNLIYSFTLFNTEYTDQDNDGIPSLLEMTSEEGSIDPTIDTDNDGMPDFRDNDDDGDGRLTILEVEVMDNFPDIDSNCDGVFTNDNDVEFLDENGNGIFDHLDNTIRVGF